MYGSQTRQTLMNELGLVDPPDSSCSPARDTDTFGGDSLTEKAEGSLDIRVVVFFADEGAQQQEIETNLFDRQPGGSRDNLATDQRR